MKFYSILFLLTISACSDNTESNDPFSETVHANTDNAGWSKIGLVAGCYQSVTNGDTSTLNLEFTDSVVAGTITVTSNEGPEKNGQVSAILRDSLLDGEMSLPHLKRAGFQFLVRNDSLLPRENAVMPGETDEGPAVFNKETAYVRVDCKQ